MHKKSTKGKGNIIGAMYERSHVNVKVQIEPCFNFFL